MIEVYQRNTLAINMSFTNDDGTPLNLSGYGLYYIAAKDFLQNTGDANINIYVTGHTVPESGQTAIILSTGNTNQCPGDYVANITLISSGSSPTVSTYGTDGLRILPNIL